MYKDNSQLRIEDFVFPYGTLDQNNDWVKLAEIVPWNMIEDRYSAQFVTNGHPAHPARMAFGALLIKQRLKCSDEWVVKHISENPYLQYFIGMKEYGSTCPFGGTSLRDCGLFCGWFSVASGGQIADLSLRSLENAKVAERTLIRQGIVKTI